MNVLMPVIFTLASWDYDVAFALTFEAIGGLFGVFAARAFSRAMNRRALVIGTSVTSTPSGASASSTALAMTPIGGMMLPSPTPLIPSGFFGDGKSTPSLAKNGS